MGSPLERGRGVSFNAICVHFFRAMFNNHLSSRQGNTPPPQHHPSHPLSRGELKKRVKFILTNYLKIKKTVSIFVVPISMGMFFIGRCRVEYLYSTLFYWVLFQLARIYGFGA
jgi:hypothetical protein